MIELLYYYPRYLAEQIGKTIPKQPFDYRKVDNIVNDLIDGNYDKYKRTGNLEIDKIIKLLKQYDTVPDPSISVDEMHKYGYHYFGMYPVSFEVAKTIPHRVYTLFPNGQELTACNLMDETRDREADLRFMKEWTDHGGMLGIIREERIRYIFKTVEDEKEFEQIIKKKQKEEKGR